MQSRGLDCRPVFCFLVSQMPACQTTLADRLDQALQTNPHVNGRTLRFETDGSRVVLQGSVKSYFQKQMAQEVIRRVEGVEQIENCLEVLWA
jgi:osmotically-inducible protein OsmY